MGDDAYRHNTHHHHAGHKKGSFLNKLFARQSSLKAAIGYGPSRGDHECSEKDDEGRASSPSRQQGEHQGSRFHFPHSPLSSSTPIFSSIRTRAGTKVGTEGLTGGRGGTREKSGAIRDCGTGEERLTGRFLPPLTPAASASVKIALDFLGSTALGVEGLYRVSGNKLDVDSLKALMAEGLLVSAETLRSHYPDKHVVAGAIKKVLQEHEPLLSYRLYADFVAASFNPSAGPPEGNEGDRACKEESGGKEGRYRALVQDLSPAPRDLLGHLMRHLVRVAERKEANRMTPENLAVTVGLHLLRKSESVTEVSIHQLEKERAVIMDLIALCPVLFPADAQASKKQAPAKPFHLPRSVKSAPPGREACHFFSLTDEMARRTAPLSMRTAEEGIDGEHCAGASVTLKPPPKPLGRPPNPLMTGSSSRQEHCLKMDHGRNRSHVNQGNMATGHVMDCAMNREEIRKKDLATAPEVWKVSTGLPSFPGISPQHPPAKPSRTTPQCTPSIESSVIL